MNWSISLTFKDTVSRDLYGNVADICLAPVQFLALFHDQFVSERRHWGFSRVCLSTSWRYAAGHSGLPLHRRFLLKHVTKTAQTELKVQCIFERVLSFFHREPPLSHSYWTWRSVWAFCLGNFDTHNLSTVREDSWIHRGWMDGSVNRWLIGLSWL